MSRPEFLMPNGELTPEICQDALLLVLTDSPPLAVIEQWTYLECVLAYDWAMRTHLRASDNLLRSREEPWFLRLARGEITMTDGQSPAQILSAALKLAAERVVGPSPAEKADRKAHLLRMASSVEELGGHPYPDDAGAQAAGYPFDPRTFPTTGEIREALGDPGDKIIRDALAAWGNPGEAASSK